MTKSADGKFHLNEPAAETHYPLGWAVETIEFEPSGKAPKKYGPNVYRFSAAMTLSVILPRRGWELVEQTKNYAYLKPPEGSDGPPFRIDIAVPSRMDFLAIAERSFAKGQSWRGQLGEWPAWYFHERNVDLKEIWRNKETGKLESQVHENPLQSNLTIGEWGIWTMTATGENGRFTLGFLSPSLQFDVRSGHPQASLQGPSLWEGSPKSVELTRYERNPVARRKCIEHFGPTCRACGLNYEKKYGALGVGLIHVHHVVPISVIGRDYKVDPLQDLVPLCATCHHVVHSVNPPLSVEQVKREIEFARQ